MRLTGLKLGSVTMPDDRTYLMSGHIRRVDRDEFSRIRAEQDGDRRVREVLLWPDEYGEFIAVRHNLQAVMSFFDEPSFLIQPLSISSPRDPRTATSAEVLGRLHGVLSVELVRNFRVRSDCQFVETPFQAGPPVLISPPFERADELLAAMLTGRYLFKTVPLFAAKPRGLGQVAYHIAHAADLNEIREAVLTAFPTVFRFDDEGGFCVLTRDRGFAKAITAELRESVGPK